jgi:glucose-1-phosphate cytidylyltransferase
MKVKELIIFAGGFGSRLSEETEIIPKPLVEIGGKPILWHIMKYYSQFGIKDFTIALGYKGDKIKKYFLDYCYLNQNLSVNLSDNSIKIHKNISEDWNINLIDTGINSLTAKRLKICTDFIKEENFYLTYGDAVSNVDINKLTKNHFKANKILTITGVKSPPRFGKISFDNNGNLNNFDEKKEDKKDIINGGFFVVNKNIIKYLKKNEPFENGPILNLLKDREMNLYIHNNFWHCMDTLADKNNLNQIWEKTKIWKNWK